MSTSRTNGVTVDSAGPPSPVPSASGNESIVASSSYAFAGQVAGAAFTAALTLYLVRALAPVQFGDFSLALGIGALVAIPSDFGIAASAQRFVAENRGKATRVAELLADAVRLKLIASGATCAALIVLAGPIASAYNAPLTWPIRGVAIAVFGQNFMFLFEAAFVASRQVASSLRVVLGESACELTASVALVLLVGGAGGAAAGRAVGYTCGGALALWLGDRAFRWRAALARRARRSHMRQVGRYAVPLMLVTGAATLFATIDILLIGAYLGSKQAGLFSAPLRLLTLIGYPGLAIAAGVTPRLVPGTDRRADALAAGLRLLIVFGAFMVAPLLVWARPIVVILLGNKYLGSVETVRVLSISAFLCGMAPLVALAANYLGEAGLRVPLMIGAAALNGLIDVILIPRIGIVSGAIATAAAYLLMVGGHIAICRRHIDVPLRALAVTTLRAGFATAVMSAILFAFGTDPSTLSIVVGAALATAAFLATLLVIGEVRRGEIASGSRWALARIRPRR